VLHVYPDNSFDLSSTDEPVLEVHKIGGSVYITVDDGNTRPTIQLDAANFQLLRGLITDIDLP
jgi:hypothetical protein